jgi:endoglucanase Acf2
MKIVLRLWLVLGLTFSSLSTSGKIVEVGGGSYSSTRPADCEALPGDISVTPDVTGAIPTNQWWSSLVWENYSQNLFPHPLAMVCHEGGLAVSYPGAGIDGRGGHIMGGGVTKTGDFVIGHTGCADFPSAKLAGYSEWFITAEFRKGEAYLRSSFGHGSPFVYNRIAGGEAVLRFVDQPMVFSGGEGDPVIGVVVRGNHYGLFGATGSKWTGLSGMTVTNESSKGYFSVALSPSVEIF